MPRRKIQMLVLLGLSLLALVFAIQSSSADMQHAQASVPTAVAAGTERVEMFLKLDTIPGESADQKHKAEIEVDSFAWGQTRAMGSSRPTMEGLKVTFPTNKASARIFLYTAGALKVSRATLSVRDVGSLTDRVRWILTDVNIVGYQTVGNVHGDGVSDQITLVPGKIELEIVPGDGSPTAKAGWDQRTNKSVSY